MKNKPVKNKPVLFSGLHAVSALLEQRPQDVLELFVLDSRADKDEARLQALITMASEQGVPTQQAQKATLEKMVGHQHQGVVARARLRVAKTEKQLSALVMTRLKQSSPVTVLVLDGVTDPHNLGACLRTADAVGVDAVVVPKRNACGLTPVVCRTAVGAAEHLAYFEVANLSRVLGDLKDAGLWVVGTDRCEGSCLLPEFSAPENRVLVMGAEGEGMRRLTREQCDYLVEIPMNGHVESLNVSVACAVMLYGLMR